MATLSYSIPAAATVVFIVVLLNPLAAVSFVYHLVLIFVSTWAFLHIACAAIGAWCTPRVAVGIMTQHAFMTSLFTTCVCVIMLAYEDAAVAVPEYALEQELSWTVALTARMVLTSWCILTAHQTQVVLQQRRNVVELGRWAVLSAIVVTALATYVGVLVDVSEDVNRIRLSMDERPHVDTHLAVYRVLLVAAASMVLQLLEAPFTSLCVVWSGGIEACRSAGMSYWLLEATCTSSMVVAFLELAVCVVLAPPTGGWGSGGSVPLLLQLMILYRMYSATVSWKMYWAFHSLLDAFQEKRDAKGAGEACCAICYEPFSAGESVRELPCHHMFHSRCIHYWLVQKRACPLCRQDPWALLLQLRQNQAADDGEGDAAAGVSSDRLQMPSPHIQPPATRLGGVVMLPSSTGSSVWPSAPVAQRGPAATSLPEHTAARGRGSVVYPTTATADGGTTYNHHRQREAMHVSSSTMEGGTAPTDVREAAEPVVAQRRKRSRQPFAERSTATTTDEAVYHSDGGTKDDDAHNAQRREAKVPRHEPSAVVVDAADGPRLAVAELRTGRRRERRKDRTGAAASRGNGTSASSTQPETR